MKSASQTVSRLMKRAKNAKIRLGLKGMPARAEEAQAQAQAQAHVQLRVLQSPAGVKALNLTQVTKLLSVLAMPTTNKDGINNNLQGWLTARVAREEAAAAAAALEAQQREQAEKSLLQSLINRWKTVRPSRLEEEQANARRAEALAAHLAAATTRREAALAARTEKATLLRLKRAPKFKTITQEADLATLDAETYPANTLVRFKGKPGLYRLDRTGDVPQLVKLEVAASGTEAQEEARATAYTAAYSRNRGIFEAEDSTDALRTRGRKADRPSSKQRASSTERTSTKQLDFKKLASAALAQAEATRLATEREAAAAALAAQVEEAARVATAQAERAREEARRTFVQDFEIPLKDSI